MPLEIDFQLTAAALAPKLQRLFELAARKIRSLHQGWDPAKGSPVFTVRGRYTSRGWTEWTQGFQFGAALLQYDATGEKEFLNLGRTQTLRWMAPHLSNVGVHDHGFNNVSTYGNLLRLMEEGKIPYQPREAELLRLALKISGAVQASRWTQLNDEAGFIHSFNGPHSLFVDTIRSLRVLALSHSLGHFLAGEGDKKISLLDRLWRHASATAHYSIYYGKGRDIYDVRGRTAHESIFNVKDGSYRCPGTQQGYSPFSTWTRGLAWALCGFAELLEYFDVLTGVPWARFGGRARVFATFREAASATADFYLACTPTDGVPMWDTGAPGLRDLGDYLNQRADPFNAWEPVDSSAAAIAAQGLIRLGNHLRRGRAGRAGERYRQAGLTVARTILDEPYLSSSPRHQGLLLHSVYHRPRGWDYLPKGTRVPHGESSMWGDYHLLELALLLWREAAGEPYLAFFNALPQAR